MAVFSRIQNHFQVYLDKYLSTRVVFLMDLALSFFSSFLMLCLGNIVSGSFDYFHGVFAVVWLVSSLVFSIVAILLIGGYKLAIRHFSLKDIARFSLISVTKVLLMCLAFFVADRFKAGLPSFKFIVIFLFLDALVTLCCFIGARVMMIMVYNVFRTRINKERRLQRVLIYRTTEKSISMVQRLANSTHFKVVGFLTVEKLDQNLKIADLPVFVMEGKEELARIARRSEIDAIIFTSEKNLQREKDSLVPVATSVGLKILISPGIDEYNMGEKVASLRTVKIEDLLGREEIKISLDKIQANFKGKVVMVTGAAGSIGSELCRQLAGFGVSKLVLFDNAETPMHYLRLELEDRFKELDFTPVIGDVRSVERLDYVFRRWRPQVVFHAAAYKHVPLMEDNPCEAVRVNVVGSRQVADKCIEYGVEKMVMISTDKAVNPTNIMGCSKRLAEIYVQSLGLAVARGQITGRTQFVTTRFGNVLGSNGSVIPRFREQIAKGGPVTVTHPDINRFFMTIPEACRLVMEAATMSVSNRIAVFDMGDPVKIDTLARRMIELSGLKPDEDIKIVYTGLRPGEKLYEEVLSNVENTEPTSHDRIRIARVREYPYEEALKAADRLETLSVIVDIPEMVKYMKAVVPEFKSKNSIYEKYDRQEN